MISYNLRLQRCPQKGVTTRIPDYQVGRAYILNTISENNTIWIVGNEAKFRSPLGVGRILYTKCIKSVHFYLQIKLSKPRWKRWKAIFCCLIWNRVGISVLIVGLICGLFARWRARVSSRSKHYAHKPLIDALHARYGVRKHFKNHWLCWFAILKEKITMVEIIPLKRNNHSSDTFVKKIN